MPATSARPSDGRQRILDAAFALSDDACAITFQSVASSTGMTKPGIMYHFPTKAKLLLALIDQSVDRVRRRMQARTGPLDCALPAARLEAYIDVCLDEAPLGAAVMFATPRLRLQLARRWVEGIDDLFELPVALDERSRARVEAARHLADALLLAPAAQVRPLPAEVADIIRPMIHSLTKEER